MKDVKESLGDVRKPDITHVRTPLLVYCARACEYGDAKYERGNYLRRTDDLVEDFKRLRAYLRAAASHILLALDSMEAYQASDPMFTDTLALVQAAYAPDNDAKPGCPVGSSGLPHLCGAAASVMMAITQAVQARLLPADPGRPWESDVNDVRKL